jgi:hypothetical protein
MLPDPQQTDDPRPPPRRHDSELAPFLHRDPQVAGAQHQLHHLIGSLLAEAARAGNIRDDVPSDELVSYSLHALAAADSL